MEMNYLEQPDLDSKNEILKQYLEEAGNVLVAYSAGVDSTFLLKTAHEVLKDRALAVTAVSPAYPQAELAEAKSFCAENGIGQILIETHELLLDGFAQNPHNRCYLCKRSLYEQIKQIAEERNIPHIVEGSNLDDDKDYRPGAQAIREMGIESPLKAAGLTKEDIRTLSQRMGLPTWNKPSMACLYSRFPYGDTLTIEKLSMVERAENIIREQGFRQVRVRMHGELARIEIEETEFPRFLQEGCMEKVRTALKELGFLYITLDLQGYRTGSMNQQIPLTE